MMERKRAEMERKSDMMEKKTAEYRKDIIRALKASGKYSRALDAQVDALAGAMRAHALASRDIDGLECTTVVEKSRYGNTKLSPHPAFKVQRDAQESITKQMKALGLTAADLSGMDDDDPLYKLTKKVEATGREKARIIRPLNTDDR